MGSGPFVVFFAELNHYLGLVAEVVLLGIIIATNLT